MAPAPNLKHQRVVRQLGFAIQKHLESTNGEGELFFAPVDVFFDDQNVFQPDLVYVSKSGIATLAADGIYGAPDLVIEVLSPGSVRHDLGKKKDIYTSSGVLEYWVVDPSDDRCDLYDPAKLIRSFHANDTLTSAIALPGISIPLSGIFGRLPRSGGGES